MPYRQGQGRHLLRLMYIPRFIHIHFYVLSLIVVNLLLFYCALRGIIYIQNCGDRCLSKISNITDQLDKDSIPEATVTYEETHGKPATERNIYLGPTKQIYMTVMEYKEKMDTSMSKLKEECKLHNETRKFNKIYTLMKRRLNFCELKMEELEIELSICRKTPG